MNADQEIKAMRRRVTICRIANNITQQARKIGQDPEKVTELIGQLKALVRQLEETGK